MNTRTIKRIFVTFLVNRVYVGTRCFERKRRLLNSVGCEIGEGTKVVGPVYNTGTLKVGKNCWLGKNLSIHGNGVVHIGDNCDLAPDVSFATGGHKIGNASRRAGEGEMYTIAVGDGTWIGTRATLVRNIRIGKGCVIAAGACVLRDVKDNTLVGGVPAKEIRTLED